MNVLSLFVFPAALFLGAIQADTVTYKSASYETQAQIIKRIIHYNDRLKENGYPRILVVGALKFDAQTVEARRVFNDAGFNAVSSKKAGLYKVLKPTDIVYVIDDEDLEGLKQICEERKAMTIALFPELVEKGDASIAIVEVKKRFPQPLINMERLTLEGHALSRDILEFSLVVKNGNAPPLL
ncbi:MAG TPA: hypothetical protein PLV56_00930 [Synergistales bacterium]|nr:hypothetical protein [Synergistales bacterium]